MTVRAWRDLRRIRKLLRSTPAVSTIAGIADGTLVQLQGEVAARDGLTLVAPLTKRACVYWELELVVVAANAAETRLAEAFDVIAFRVGPTEIDVAGSQFRVATSHTTTTAIAGGALVGVTPDQGALLRQLELHDHAWGDATGLRYAESIVGVGDRVAVIGTVRGGQLVGTDEAPLAVVSR